MPAFPAVIRNCIASTARPVPFIFSTRKGDGWKKRRRELLKIPFSLIMKMDEREEGAVQKLNSQKKENCHDGSATLSRF